MIYQVGPLLHVQLSSRYHFWSFILRYGFHKLLKCNHNHYSHFKDSCRTVSQGPSERQVFRVKVKVILRPTVRHPSGTRNQLFSIFLWLFLDSCGFVDVGRPLWRVVGSVLFSFCRASPAQPFSHLSPTELMSIAYCLYFWDSPNLEGQVPAFIPPGTGWPSYTPRHWVRQVF
jgi:hypothetical protein